MTHRPISPTDQHDEFALRQTLARDAEIVRVHFARANDALVRGRPDPTPHADQHIRPSLDAFTDPVSISIGRHVR